LTAFGLSLQWLHLAGKRFTVEKDIDKASVVDKLDFEQALNRLNELVNSLETGELPLEESVAAFEAGVKLSRRCEALLDTAEQRLQVLGDEEQS